MKIFDCFPFFNEIDTLKIRLELLGPYVDHFVICEANITHSGNSKPFYFELNKDQFKEFEKKIIHLKYEPDLEGLDFSKKDDSYNSNSAPWKIEKGQRNHLWSYLKEQADNDIAIISDADEIWNPQLAIALKESLNLNMARLEMQFHYYFLNCRGVGLHNRTWTPAYFAKIQYLKINSDLSKIRQDQPGPVIQNAGWHFSYLGGAQKIKEKMEAFAHQEFNQDAIKDLEKLECSINSGLDHLGRQGHDWAFYPTESYHKDLIKIMAKYPHLVKA